MNLAPWTIFWSVSSLRLVLIPPMISCNSSICFVYETYKSWIIKMLTFSFWVIIACLFFKSLICSVYFLNQNVFVVTLISSVILCLVLYQFLRRVSLISLSRFAFCSSISINLLFSCSFMFRSRSSLFSAIKWQLRMKLLFSFCVWEELNIIVESILSFDKYWKLGFKFVWNAWNLHFSCRLLLGLLFGKSILPLLCENVLLFYIYIIINFSHLDICFFNWWCNWNSNFSKKKLNNCLPVLVLSMNNDLSLQESKLQTFISSTNDFNSWKVISHTLPR